MVLPIQFKMYPSSYSLFCITLLKYSVFNLATTTLTHIFTTTKSNNSPTKTKQLMQISNSHKNPATCKTQPPQHHCHYPHYCNPRWIVDPHHTTQSICKWMREREREREREVNKISEENICICYSANLFLDVTISHFVKIWTLMKHQM